MSFKLKVLFLCLFFPLTSMSADYCLGIRGNGDLVAAHWPAMSKIVQKLGMPKALSAGSSASYSSFLLESVAMNELAKNKEQQAFLVSTFPVYLQAFLERSGGQKILDGDANALTYAGLARYLGIANPEAINVSKLNKNGIDSIKEAASKVGKFDAVNDKAIFVRPGVVDFKYVAIELMGRMGDFYAGYVGYFQKQKMKRLINNCSGQIPASESCLSNFKSLVHSSFNSIYRRQRIFQKIGRKIPAYISTGLIIGDGISKYEAAKKAYVLRSEGYEKVMSDLSFDFESEMAFGYWGDREGLERIDRDLDKENDLKSQKFKIIGEANWFEALSVSPAEPGLANLQKIPTQTTKAGVWMESKKPNLMKWKGLNYREDMISTGGWSDLHPVQLLKARGCDNVMYLTRTDGESVFAQQVFIRLSGQTKAVPFWKDLAKYNREGWNPSRKEWVDTLAKQGDTVSASPWNLIMNIGNPDSSFSNALKSAEAVQCTDWNNQSMKEFDKLLSDSFEAPTFTKSDNVVDLEVNSPEAAYSAEDFPGCISK